jgi:hypothetical protein
MFEIIGFGKANKSLQHSQPLNPVESLVVSSLKMRTAKSVMQAPSFKPELEFEVIKLVLLRERYLQRLETKLQEKDGKVDMAVIGIVDVLRDCSIEIVETIQTWERTQVKML